MFSIDQDYKRSYQYFKKWARLSEEIMGPDHPKTLRAKGVLRESRYRRIAMELGEWVEDDDDLQVRTEAFTGPRIIGLIWFTEHHVLKNIPKSFSDVGQLGK